MSRTLFVTRLLTVLVLIALLRNGELLPALVRDPFSLLGLVVFLYLALSLLSVIGLLLTQSWGFYLFYILVAFGTVMLSVSFVPLSLRFPADKPWIVSMLLNATVVGLAILGHQWRREELIAAAQRTG
jgi:hypothetical protein